MRQRGRGRDPRRIHRGIEFDPGHASIVDALDRGERLLEARDNDAALRGERPLLVDDHRGEGLGRDQSTGKAALALRLGELDRPAGVADRRHAQCDFAQRAEIVAQVHVAVPQARNERLAGAVDHARSGGQLGQRGADADDLAVRDEDVLSGDEALVVRVVDLHVAEQHRLA